MERTDGCASCGEPCGGAPAYVCEDCGRTYCAACAGRKKARKSPPANAGGRVLPAKFSVKFSVKKSDILPG